MILDVVFNRKLFYLADVALLGGHIVIKDNFGHAKVTPTVDKLKMATAMLDHVDRLFGMPTGLFCIGSFTAELRAREAKGFGAGLK